jgi:hypothetical protein
MRKLGHISPPWILGLVGLLVAVTMGLMLVDGAIVYTTEAVVQLSSTRQGEGEFLSSQLALLKNPTTLGRALAPSKIADLSIVKSHRDAVAWLQQELVVEPTGTNMIRVRITGKHPMELEKLMSSVIEAYMEESIMGEKRQRMETLEWTRSRAGSLAEEVQTLRNLTRDLANSIARRDSLRQELQVQMKGKPKPETEKTIVATRNELASHEGVLKVLNDKVEKTLADMNRRAHLERQKNDETIRAIEAEARTNPLAGAKKAIATTAFLTALNEGFDKLIEETNVEWEPGDPGRALATLGKKTDIAERMVQRVNEVVAKQEVEGGPVPVQVWDRASSRRSGVDFGFGKP